MSSIIKVDQIQLADGSTPTAADLGLNVTGAVLQVVQTVMDDNLSYSTSSAYDIPGMAVTITPTSATSKFLIRCQLHYGQGASSAPDDFVVRLRLKRNGTELPYTVDSGRTSGDYSVYKEGYGTLDMDVASFERLDSPSTTDTLTYQVTGYNGGWATNPVMYNRPYRFDDNDFVISRARSTLTVMEIAG